MNKPDERLSPCCGAEMFGCTVPEYEPRGDKMVFLRNRLAYYRCSQCGDNCGSVECHKPVKPEEGNHA